MIDHPSRTQIRYATAARQVRYAAGLTPAQAAELLGVTCEDVFLVEAARASSKYGRKYLRRLILVVAGQIVEAEGPDMDVWLCELGGVA